jgi:hypothetical protein
MAHTPEPRALGQTSVETPRQLRINEHEFWADGLQFAH